MNTQIAFRNMEPSAAVEEHVRRRAERLQRFHDRIVGCHVVVEMPHRHHHNGKLYQTRIDIAIPGGEVVVRRNPPENLEHEDLHACIEAAFDDAERQLEDWVRQHRGDVKTHERSTHGRVKKLFSHEGYGFLENDAGDEVYFHRNAVNDNGFDRLAIGDRVRFAEEMGNDGPQATFVDWVRHPRHSSPSLG